jgi:hypothetical protein
MGIGFSFGGSKDKNKSETDRTQAVTGTNAGSISGSQQQSFWTPEQSNLAGILSNTLLGNLQNPDTQTQKLISGFQTGKGPAAAAAAAYKRAATGQGYGDIIDPKATEAMYAAIEKQTLEDILPKTTNAIAGNANLAGMLRSGPALKMQLENRNQIVNELAKQLMSLRYSDEQQRRQVAQEREGRQMAGAQGLQGLTEAKINAGMVDPQQATINNIMTMLGIRGTTTQQTQQNTSEQMTRALDEYIKSKGKGSSGSAGFSLGLG